MNDILQLKGRFEQKNNSSHPGASKLPKGTSVKIEHLIKLREELKKVLEFWKHDSILNDILVSVYYRDVVAKSNRIKGLLTMGSKHPNDSIVGSKFNNGKMDKLKHIITHCITEDVLLESIHNLEKTIKIVRLSFEGEVSYEDIERINKKEITIDKSIISKTKFVNIIVDSYYVEKFGIETEIRDIAEDAIVTIYQTGISTAELMHRLNINLLSVRSIDETTLLLTKEQYLRLKDKAPYLIAMAVEDLSLLSKEDFEFCNTPTIAIPEPKNEPTIGVIDTLFDGNVYFSKWVEFNNMVDSNLPISYEDYQHGTKVSSIIVDGPALNPDLDDGCGRFKVRHFGVATNGKFSSFTILRSIKDIVANNKDIKVWNLSLGSSMEINNNFISPEAAILDQIQYENDVIFVIAGTNKNPEETKRKRIGAPADSINSLVVNSVNFDGEPASYSREGLVLSFFNKPDVSYYGGDKKQKIRAYSPKGPCMVSGTSYAAPWISRKMAYLIHIMGLSREVAKALLIDSATDWNESNSISHIMGYGIVPKRIEDIINSPEDEIRFILSGTSEKYDTYNYNIPVPIYKEKQPFIAKATLCYFPKCSRNQGVDYTNTELDLHFGRIKDSQIKSINNNKQGTNNPYTLKEGSARDFYRKWDNVKHISEEFKIRTSARKVYDDGLWGISIKTKERLDGKDGIGLNFGVVVSLKEINGVNRIEEFIQQCAFRGWLVNRIDVENQIDIYNKAEEEVIFE